MRRIIHLLIMAYLQRSGGAFHTRPYGPDGRYVVVMNESEYHEHRHSEEWRKGPSRIVYPVAIPMDGFGLRT